jgi:2'-5' RNA ligase
MIGTHTVMRSRFHDGMRWPDGRRELVLLALPDLQRDRELRALVNDVRAVTKQHPATTRPVPDEWLHVTVQAINHEVDAASIRPPAQHQLISDLAKVFAEMPSFTMLLGSILAYGGGVVTDVHHDRPFNEMVEQVRATIAGICGPGSIGHDSRPGHMALVYADAEQESDALQSQLRRVRPSHAPMWIDEVVLAEVAEDPQACAYRWNVLHRFPLQPAESGVASAWSVSSAARW